LVTVSPLRGKRILGSREGRRQFFITGQPNAQDRNKLQGGRKSAVIERL